MSLRLEKMLRLAPTSSVVKSAVGVAASSFKDRLHFVTELHHAETTGRKLAFLADVIDASRRLITAASISTGSSAAGRKELALRLSALSRRLGSLDVASLTAVYQQLNKIDLIQAKDLLMDLVLQSGSQAGVVLLLRDFAIGNRRDDWTVARLLVYAAAHSRSNNPINDSLQAEFESFLGDDKSAAPIQSSVVRNSAVLAVSTFLGKIAAEHETSSVDNKTKNDLIDTIQKWHNKFFLSLTDSETSFNDKAVYIHALCNLGSANGQTVGAMLLLLSDKHFDDDLKVYVVQGLKMFKNRSKVSRNHRHHLLTLICLNLILINLI